MRPSPQAIRAFRRRIMRHFQKHGRDMPWRRTRDPWRILVSEMMLQQTQVARVLRYYPKFIRRFPTAASLARAPLSDALLSWQGLGYNRRALWLKRSAEKIVQEYGSRVPRDPASLAKLPGVGKGSAGAVAAFAFGAPVPFIETNIRRVYIRAFFPRGKKVSDGDLMPLIERTVDRKNPRQWYYALMDYGAALGRSGAENPNRRSRHYARQSKFEGSDRELRAAMIRLVLAERGIGAQGLAAAFPGERLRIGRIVAMLAKEGFLIKSGGKFLIA